MTTFNKNTIEKKSEDLSKEAKNNIKTLSNSVKSSTDDVADDLVETTEKTKDKAVSLVEQIQHLVSTYTEPAKINALKSDVYDKAKTFKDAVGNDVSATIKTGKKKTIKTVRNNPLGSVAVAAGVGAVLGYLIASKRK